MTSGSATAASAATAWRDSAARLAARSTRRTRVGAVLRGAAAGVAAGALLAAGIRALHLAPATTSVAALAAATALGLAIGARAATRARRTSVEDSAWALDRVAQAHERGLSAALVGEPAAAAAAEAAGPPPSVRLEPPAGLAPLVAAVLLAVGAMSIPATAHDAARDAGAERDGGRDAASARRTGGGADAIEAGRTDLEADEASRRASKERAVREALGLPKDGALDPAEVAERLASPAARDAARGAAEPGSDAAKALAVAGPPDEQTAVAVASALSSDAAARAEALRRVAGARRASAGAAGAAFVPPARRDVVARYLEARLAAPAPTDASGARAPAK